MKKTIAVSCILISLVAVLSSCTPGSREKLYKKSRISMDTVVSITVSSASGRDVEAAIDRAFGEIERLGRLMNFFSGDSELSLINKSAGIRPVTVSKETYEVIERAVFAAEKTKGAFDVTIGPVSSLWDFQKKALPEGKTLRERVKLVNYRNIALDKARSTVFLRDKGMMIDLGGIVKGYAADKGVEALKKSGIKSGVVAVGGEVKAFGLRPDRAPWNIGIKNPRQTGAQDEVIAAIGLSDMAISTAGDYEKFFIKDGVRYHHILDPKTGMPAQGCRSVSIVTRDGVMTDSLSTGIFILGPQKGLAVLREMEIDGIIIDSGGKISVTEGIKGRIEFKGKPS